jgi:hypothetical protein
MNPAAEAIVMKTVADSELRSALECCLTDFYGTRQQIDRFERQISDYRSSFCLEELTAQLDNGTNLSVMFKDLGFDSLLESGRRAKPEFLYEPEREIFVYRKVLSGSDFSTAVCYGNLVERETRRYWLFLEKVSGVELYQVGDLDKWKCAAMWLAEFHGHFANKTERLSAEPRLLKYDERLYREWMKRAQDFLAKDGVAKEIKEQLEWLATRYDIVIEQLARIPRTFLHGEFYASNVLVETVKGKVLRVCPIDWEMAGIGPGLIDLAALTAGGWGEEERARLAWAYYHALPQREKWFPSEEDFQKRLQYCRLYLAVQWIGWFGRRKPFAAHAQDWLGEAVCHAKALGL